MPATPTLHPTDHKLNARDVWLWADWHWQHAEAWAKAHTNLVLAGGVAVVVALVLLSWAWRSVKAQWAGRKTRERRANLKKTAPQRSATPKLRSLVGYPASSEAEVVESWPKHPDRTGATIRIRCHESWSPTATQLARISETIAHFTRRHGGEWLPEYYETTNKLDFVRQQPPFQWPKTLTYSDLKKPAHDQIPLGVKDGGAPFVWDLSVSVYAHGGVFGTTGAGKSNALRELIVGFAQQNALIDILDAKGGEDFEDFATHPGIRVWTEVEDMLEVLAEFKREMERRRPTRGKARQALPRRVLIIDETAEVKTAVRLLGKAGEDYVTTLLTIARLARSVRMHLVCATQKPGAKALTGDATTGAELRDLLGFKLGLGQLSGSSANMAFDAEPPHVDAVAGRGVVHVNGQFTHIQTARLELDEAVKLTFKGSARFPEDRVMPSEDLNGVTRDYTGTEIHPPETLVSLVKPPAQDAPPQAHADFLPIDLVGDPSRAVTKPRRGRPPAVERTPVLLICECRQAWESKAAEGNRVKCPACGKGKDVPIGARAGVADAVQR